MTGRLEPAAPPRLRLDSGWHSRHAPQELSVIHTRGDPLGVSRALAGIIKGRQPIAACRHLCIITESRSKFLRSMAVNGMRGKGGRGRPTYLPTSVSCYLLSVSSITVVSAFGFGFGCPSAGRYGGAFLIYHRKCGPVAWADRRTSPSCGERLLDLGGAGCRSA